MTGIVLYDYWRSSAAYRLRIGLGLLGLNWTAVPVDLLAGDQRGAANLARNPQGLVPTLDIDGLTLTQSLAILEYLDETRAAGWLPPDAPGRARVRALAYAVAMDIHPVCNHRVARHATPPGEDLGGWMRHFIALGFQGLETLLARGPQGRYCHGDQVTLADVCLVPQVYNARRWGVDLTSYPGITRIDTALTGLPAFAAAHPERVGPGG